MCEYNIDETKGCDVRGPGIKDYTIKSSDPDVLSHRWISIKLDDDLAPSAFSQDTFVWWKCKKCGYFLVLVDAAEEEYYAMTTCSGYPIMDYIDCDEVIMREALF